MHRAMARFLGRHEGVPGFASRFGALMLELLDVESRLDRTLTLYFTPRDEESSAMRAVFLASNIAFGTKVEMLRRLLLQAELDKEFRELVKRLEKLVTLRNQLAHNRPSFDYGGEGGASFVLGTGKGTLTTLAGLDIALQEAGEVGLEMFKLDLAILAMRWPDEFDRLYRNVLDRGDNRDKPVTQP